MRSISIISSPGFGKTIGSLILLKKLPATATLETTCEAGVEVETTSFTIGVAIVSNFVSRNNKISFLIWLPFSTKDAIIML
jgi:hypothetical protein